MNQVELARPAVTTPGCFGYPSTFKHTSPICSKCSSKAACADKVSEKLNAIAKKVDISDFVARHDNESGLAPLLTKESVIQLDAKKPVKRIQPVSVVKRTFSEQEELLIASLPKKVAVIARQIMQDGVDKTAIRELIKGVNPFAFNGKRFLHLACKLLLDDGFTRKQLMTLYMEKTSETKGMTKDTAASHVTMALSMFKAFKMVVESNGVFKINKGENQ